jgi:hypothetical protein
MVLPPLGSKTLLLTEAVRGKHSYQTFKYRHECQWILRNFAYHDILGSVTSVQRAIMDAEYLKDITDVFNIYLGGTTSLLVFVAAMFIDYTYLSGCMAKWE